MVTRLRRLSLIFTLSVLAGCGSLPPSFTMYPQVLSSTDKVASDIAVVLVGVSGPGRVYYLQFNHASLPAINVRFLAQGDSIIAVPIPVGIKQLTLTTITIAGHAAGYIGSLPFGFIPVHTHKIDIDVPGIYFLATVDTTKSKSYSGIPDPTQLREVRERLGSAIVGLKPVNFQWPQ